MAYHALNVNLIDNAEPIGVDRNLSPVAADQSFLSTVGDNGFSQAYKPGAIDYQTHEKPPLDGELLSLVAVPKADAQTIISATGETAFRSLAAGPPVMAQPLSTEDARKFRSPYSFHELGSYDLANLPATVRNPDPLTYVPLGIYQPPLVSLVRDAAGNPLPGGPITLQPTLNPASFIPGPP